MIKEIQYLRGIACLLVVFTHYKLPYLEIFNGSIGVDIFFIISGFIISTTIDRYFKNPNEFILNRLIRIYPVWIVLGFLTFFMFLVFSPFDKLPHLESIILSPLFIGEFSIFYSEPIIFSGWSLRYEVLFYLLVFFFLKMSKTSQEVKLRLVYFLTLTGLTGLFFDLKNIHLDIFISSYNLLFAAGVFIEMKSDFIKTTFKFRRIHLLMSIFLLIFVMLFSDQGYSFIGNAKEFINLDDYGLIRRFFVWGIPSIIFFVVFTYSNLKENNILMYFGNISYSLYLIHSLFKPFVSSSKFLDLIGLNQSVIYIITIIVSIILSHFSKIYLEQDLSNFLKKQIKKYNENNISQRILEK